MDFEHVIHQFGGSTSFAKLIGAKPQQVSNWRVRGVPVEQCIAIERATKGAVRCEDLRPDVDWAVLRNSDCPKEAA
jgi:DNA-binding transcriptional regulator YdaS (Cro superfamily)